MQLLGHATLGTGAERVLVLNDWLCDTSTWDGARSYLDTTRFTFAFVDLRGYGRSRSHPGEHTAREATSDVLAVADALGWSRFAIVGHSMSTLIAIDLAQHHADRVTRVVLITPPPPHGFGADDAYVAAARGPVLAGDAARTRMLIERFGERLSPGWGRYKAQRWVETADADAAAGYLAMFARDGIPDRTTTIAAPVLAITGEVDAGAMRAETAREKLAPLCPSLTVVELAACGHYPMQEMPPLTVAHLERFLTAG